jgi:glucose-6-phosphate 1-dehydrogenase
MPVKKETTPAFILTIFGASGDLAKLKIFPAIYELLEQGRLPTNFWIVGYARTTMTRKEFQNVVSESVQKRFGAQVKKSIVDTLLSHVHYFPGAYTELADFEKYVLFLDTLQKKTTMIRMAYFSVPPTVFQDIIRNLALSRRSTTDDIRLILEKPFGTSCASATELFHSVSQYFPEDHLYLLDHYLGKTAVRSIMNLRHSNRILSLMMQGRQIANIQITKAETIGVEERGEYFDSVGSIKDMVQSHLLQLLALVTMDIPVTRTRQSLQRERLSVLSAIECPSKHDNIVIGQYKGYTQEEDIQKKSKTETFTALRLFLDREDWYNTPIYIRTGKRLNESHAYIVVELEKFPFQDSREEPNRLIFELSPNERVNITLLNKQDDVNTYQELTTSDSIACDIDGCLGEHATLLLDVLHGRHMHFVSFAEVIASWRIVDKISSVIKKRKVRLETYATGSIGPKSQNSLTSMDGFEWYDLHEHVSHNT